MTATNGSKLTKEADGSIMVDGAQKNGEVVTIVAETDLAGITGVRLEALHRRPSCRPRAPAARPTATSC